MCFLNRLLIIAVLMIALVVWMPGLRIEEYSGMRLFALFLGAANAFVRPLLLLFGVRPGGLPIAATALIINAFAFFLASRYSPGIQILSMAKGSVAFLIIWGVSIAINRYVYIEHNRL